MVSNDAKTILKYLLEQAILQGSLNKAISVRYDLLAEKLGFESKHYCRICCEYLNQLDYADFIQDGGDISDIGIYNAKIKAARIDFLESKA